jgi:Zn-dependent protease with chaperone function
MRYAQLMTLATLASFALSSTAAAMCVALAWWRVEPLLAPLFSAARSRIIFILRLAPTLIGGFASVLTVAAFLRYEPRSTVERPGFVLLAAASCGAALLLAGWSRVVMRCWRTLRFLQAIERSGKRVTVPGMCLPAWQLDTAFPLIAIAGTWRPRFLIARCVLEQIPRDELRVVVGHELAHARQRDNIVRLLFTAMPDVLALADRWLRLERAWSAAAEEAADDLATGDDPEARLCLASALVRVSKMAGQRTVPMPLLAFHSGESVEGRVRRLVDFAAPRPHIPVAALRYMTVALLAGAVPLLLRPAAFLVAVHYATEWLVNRP